MQVNFSQQSIDVLNKLDRLDQMRLVESFTSLTPQMLHDGSPDLGKFHRDGCVFYRLRAGDLRIYFEVSPQDGSLMAHYILNQHSLSDFVFRFTLPMSDMLLIEEHPSFWNYLESLKK